MPYGPKSSEAEHTINIVLSQVVRGRPTGLHQSVGGLSAAAMTRWWFSSEAERARCPKNLRRKDFTLSETGKQAAILRSPDCVVGSVPGVWVQGPTGSVDLRFSADTRYRRHRNALLES